MFGEIGGNYKSHTQRYRVWNPILGDNEKNIGGIYISYALY